MGGTRGLSLAETVAGLRRSRLTARGAQGLDRARPVRAVAPCRPRRDEGELIQALRQCDGVNVQCLVLVRDDFAMAAARFMRALEIRLVESQNFATVDLFDLVHARKVLRAFGVAYDRFRPGEKGPCRPVPRSGGRRNWRWRARSRRSAWPCSLR